MSGVPTYWIERLLVEEDISDITQEEYMKRMRTAFHQTERRIVEQLESFYQRYADERGITVEKATAQLTNKEKKSFIELQRDYLATLEKLGMRPSKLAERQRGLDRLSGMAYVQKQQELLMSISLELDKLYTKLDNDGQKVLGKSYLRDRNLQGYYNHKDGIGASFSKVTDKQVKKAVNAKWEGSSFSDRIWEHKEKLIANLHTMLPQHFVRSSGSREIAEDLAKRMNVSVSNAQRLVHTEMHRIRAVAKIDEFKSADITKYRFIATLDNRTSDVCRHLDGKVFDVETAQAGINIPPLHPWCRSTMIPEFDDIDFMNEIAVGRAARDSEGKSYHETDEPFITFNDWVDTKAGAYAKRELRDMTELDNYINSMVPSGGAVVAAFASSSSTPTEPEPIIYNGLTEAEITQQIVDQLITELPDDYNGIEEMVKAADLNHKVLLHAMQNDFKYRISTIKDKSREGSYLHPATAVKNAYVHINVKSETKGGAVVTKEGSVLFHELGHYVDYLYANKRGMRRGSLFTSEDSRLRDTIFKEYRALYNKRKAEITQEVMTLLKVDDPKHESVKRRMKYRMSENIFEDFTVGLRYEVLSDILGGLSNNRYRGDWGHANSYWAGALKQNNVPNEFFAHLFGYNMRLGSNHASIKDGLPAIKKLLPESVNMYNNIIKEMVETIISEEG